MSDNRAHTNRAAWLVGKQVSPLKVDTAPFPSPGPGEVVIKIRYCAMNPADWKIIKYGHRVDKFPAILGQDVAGEILTKGEGVENVRQGDRVIAHMFGIMTLNPIEGAFQEFGLAKAVALARIPDSMAFENAVVLPLAISTATVGLYTPQQLALPLPTVPSTPSRRQVLLVWGGSSSVGATTIQLAKASGYSIAATCSPRNNDFVKSLGAEHLFDYSSSSVVQDVVSRLQGQSLVGIYNAIGGEESNKLCIEIISRLPGPSNKMHIASVPPVPSDPPEGIKVVALGSAANMFVDDSRKHIAEAIWQRYLPQALANGQLRPEPEPLLAGEGVESIQTALDILQGGVSAKKVIVRVQ